jgi:Helix-hairpin-helix motif
VPLTAIRGLGPEAAQHILAARAAFGSYSSLLDFCRKVDRRRVSRHDLLLLIKLGAFGFTGLSRAQLVAAEQYYAAAADVLRFADGDPAGLATLENDLVRLQGLLLERLLGAPGHGEARAPEGRSDPPGLPSARTDVVAAPAQDETETTPPDEALTPAVTDPTPSAEAEKVGTSEAPTVPVDAVVVTTTPVASRASRYYQPGARPASVPVRPQDLALMRRLHELGDVSTLILQFGPYKGSTLAQVAIRHPEYLRQRDRARGRRANPGGPSRGLRAHPVPAGRIAAAGP